jgi:hypothetical protein
VTLELAVVAAGGKIASLELTEERAAPNNNDQGNCAMGSHCKPREPVTKL